jgi:plasmid stabilization system protein ParE
MQLRWSPAAAEDLFRIIEYIRQESPVAAQHRQDNLRKCWFVEVSSTQGYNGPRGRDRELPLPALPFVVVYRVLKDLVEIANVVHGAQKWPPEE